ncbi:MAG TPA: ABC transporter substrate-binding protein [Bryobacteraceae bacterium]
MRPILWRFTAAANALLALVLAIAATLHAARRPHYGGELRVEMHASLRTLDPMEIPDDPAALAAQRLWLPAVFETLVRLDDQGRPQPWLATSWVRDPQRKSWIFTVRKDVKFHDGTPWSPAGGVLAFPDDRPIDQILRELAGARNAITLRAADGSLLGTGPYRIARWDAGKSATLAANEQYWGGPPYLDTIAIQMSRTLAEQASDFQIGKADAAEIPLRDLRAAKQKGTLTSETPPMETLALVFENGRVAGNIRKALALSIDRTAIFNVLLQKQGEISGALLPRWLSGYAFLFPAERDVAKARQMAAAPASLNFAYDREDPVVRPIAERIAVNAMEAGIALRPGNNPANPIDLRLLRLPITTGDPWLALQDLAAVLKMPAPAATASPYEAEKSLLDGSGAIPLFQLPQAWVLRSRVRNWPRFEEIWLDSGAP